MVVWLTSFPEGLDMMKHAAVVTMAVVLGGAAALAQDDAAVEAKGKEIFAAQHCTMCHSIAGQGNKNMPLDGVGSRLKPEQIRKYIVSPREVKADSKMKAYPSLSPADLDALVAYLSSLKKKD
jgi:cytochrome c oxidase subunit 2